MAKRRKAKKSAVKRMSLAAKIRTITARRSAKRGKQVTARGRARAKINRLHPVPGYSANPFHKRRVTRRRRGNPISLTAVTSTAKQAVMPVALGTAASIALDKAMVYLPVPMALRAPGKETLMNVYLQGMRFAAILAAVAIGRKVSPRNASAINGAGIGAMTVTATDTVRLMMLTSKTGVAGFENAMNGFTLEGFERPALSGDAAYMGDFDSAEAFNSINSTLN